MLNMSSWRFGSDHVPSFSWVICRLQPLIFHPWTPRTHGSSEGLYSPPIYGLLKMKDTWVPMAGCILHQKKLIEVQITPLPPEVNIPKMRAAKARHWRVASLHHQLRWALYQFDPICTWSYNLRSPINGRKEMGNWWFFVTPQKSGVISIHLTLVTGRGPP